MATTLNDLINDYGSYSGNTLVGERGARASIPNSGFGGVSGVPYDNITFIVEIDGKKYASSKWLATQKNTPYQDQNNVAGAGLSIRTATAIRVDADNQGQTLDDQETYAEVKVNKNLQTADDILKHINWLVSDGDALRPVTDYGNWQWNYDPTKTSDPTIIMSPLGTEFKVGVTYTGFTSKVAGGFVGKYNADSDYRGIEPGLRFEATGWDGTKTGEGALSNEPNTTSKPIEVVTETESEILKPPKETIVSGGITVSTPTGTFTGIDQNFLLGDANNNTGNADVRDTIRQLSTSDGLDRTGLRAAYDSGDLGPMAAMFDDGNYDSFGSFGSFG